MFDSKRTGIPVSIAVAVLLSTAATTACLAGNLKVNVDIGVPVQPAPPNVYMPPPEPLYVAPPPAYAPPSAPVYLAPPPPAQTVLPATPPQFIFVPELGYYVAIGIAADMIYDGRAYYYHNNGYWYRTTYYGAPWQLVTARALPQLLVKFRFNDIHHYRDKEFRHYEHDKGRYKGHLHRPEVKGNVKKEERHEEKR